MDIRVFAITATTILFTSAPSLQHAIAGAAFVFLYNL